MTAAAAPRAAVSPLALAVAGSAAVGTAFGMARYGFGLLLPDMRADLRLGPATLGAIGTGGYVTYVLATAAAGRLLTRAGERATLVAGGAFAVVGTLVVAAAQSWPALAAGVALAGASAGLVFPPFADAADRLPEAARTRVVAAVNSGTGWGVALAAPIAIVAGEHWRLAWVGFAVCAAASTAAGARTLSARRSQAVREQAALAGAGALVAAALLVGLGSAAYWTFAVEQVRAGGLDQAAGRLVLGAAGIGSVLGVAAADLVRRLGARRTFVLAAGLEAAAIAATGLVPGSLGLMLAAAVLFGAAYNVAVAVAVLDGTRLRPQRPSSGLALVVGANAAGLLAGPLAGGVVAGPLGLTATLLAGAAIVASAALFAPR